MWARLHLCVSTELDKANIGTELRHLTCHRLGEYSRELFTALVLLPWLPTVTFTKDFWVFVPAPLVPTPVATMVLSFPSLYTTNISLGLPSATLVKVVNSTSFQFTVSETVCFDTCLLNIGCIPLYQYAWELSGYLFTGCYYAGPNNTLHNNK